MGEVVSGQFFAQRTEGGWARWAFKSLPPCRIWLNGRGSEHWGGKDEVGGGGAVRGRGREGTGWGEGRGVVRRGWRDGGGWMGMGEGWIGEWGWGGMGYGRGGERKGEGAKYTGR